MGNGKKSKGEAFGAKVEDGSPIHNVIIEQIIVR